jgi:hypothetical protein
VLFMSRVKPKGAGILKMRGVGYGALVKFGPTFCECAPLMVGFTPCKTPG